MVPDVVGTDVGDRGEGVGRGSTADSRELVSNAVDTVVGVKVSDDLPAVLGVGRTRNRDPFPVGLVVGTLLDDVEDEAAAVRGVLLLLAHGDRCISVL